MKLVFIHGREQEGEIESLLKQKWIDSFKEGLSQSGLTLPSDTVIEFPYYGEQIIKFINSERPVSAKSEARRSGESSVNTAQELKFYQSYLKEIAKANDLTKAEEDELNELLSNTRGKENYKVVHLIAKVIDAIPILRESLTGWKVDDVFMYLTNHNIKAQINKMVEDCIGKEPCVVVGHSLGSIVGYNVLTMNTKFHVKKYITLGSPLGVSAIKTFISTISMPKCVKNGWFNAFDKKDIVSLYPLDTKHFNIQPPIENYDKVDNFTDNKHSIEGYLCDKTVAKEIHKALLS